VKRFGKTKEGRYFHVGDDRNLYEVQPPKGVARLANIGGGVGPALPVATGTTAGIMTAPAAATGVGLAGTVAATAAAGGAGEWARQKIGDVLLGEAATNEVNPWAVAGEAAHGGLGHGAGTAVGAWMNKNVVPDIAKYSAEATNALLEKARKAGVRLTPAEATGLESLVGDQKRLMGVPQSANHMKEFTRERNQEAYDAFQAFLGKLSPAAQDAHELGMKAKGAAETVMEGAKAARAEVTSPLYNKAFSEGVTVDTAPIARYIDDAMTTARGPIRTALEKANHLLKVPGSDQYDTSLKGLDAAKKAIDDMLEGLHGAEGIGANARYHLNNIRASLIAAMDSAPSSSGAYQAGRKAHEAITANVVDPTRAALSPLLRLQGEESVAPNLKRAAQAMFDPAGRTPDLIRTARMHFTQGKRAQPELWNGLVRQFIHEEAAGALRTMAQGEMRNVAGGVQKALTNEPTLANIKAALSPGQWAEFSDLMDVFRAAGRAVDTNSDTAFKTQAIERAKREAGGWLSTFFRNINPAEAARNAANFFAERNYERQAEALAKTYTSRDTEAITKLRALKDMKPNDWRRYAVVGAVLERLGMVGGEYVLDHM
jgi:hypothetical protein